MLIFLDTECTDLERPRLISIGLLAHCHPPAPFYVELVDTYETGDCSAFTRQEVIPRLLGGSSAMSSTDARRHMRAWIEGFCESADLVTDYPELDADLLRDWLGYEWPAHCAEDVNRAIEDRVNGPRQSVA